MSLERMFWPVLAAIVTVAGAIEVRSALGETQTWDEGIHIAAGYGYLTRGDYRWNVEHPPLVKVVSALPLLGLGLEMTPRKDQVQNGIDFLYHNRKPADTILFAARSANILLTLAFIAAIACWTRRRWGTGAGLFAAAMIAFDPNLMAHGRYVTTDYPVMVFFFFACVLWVEYLESGGWKRLAAAAAAMALAMVVKFSAILLGPPLVLLYAACRIRRPEEFPLRRAATAAAVVMGVLAATVALVYWPETVRCWSRGVAPLATIVNRDTVIGNSLYLVGRKLHLPAHPFLVGLNVLADHNAQGQESYLLGMRSKTGWWYYFPVVFAVKSPLAALVCTVLLGVTWAKRGMRGITPMTLGLALPPLIYFAVSMTSAINIGMRHILPIYPFLYVGTAGLIRLSKSRILCYVLAAVAMLQVGECASIYPDYLAFFNAAAGGPGRGPEYLVDSNIDWGQDVKKLKHWLDEHGTRRALVFYFGNTQLSYYGVEGGDFPGPEDQKGWDAIDDYCVANVTPLYGVYVPPEALARLRARKPVAKIGWSMYVYDLRKR